MFIYNFFVTSLYNVHVHYDLHVLLLRDSMAVQWSSDQIKWSLLQIDTDHYNVVSLNFPKNILNSHDLDSIGC